MKRLAPLGLLLALAAPASAAHFKSPTGNIQCRLDSHSVTCLLQKNSWRHLPAKPASCDVDWAPTDMSLYVNRQTGRWTVAVGGCRGDVGPLCYSEAPCVVLAYGHSVQSVRAGSGLRCTSATSGVTCMKIGTRPGARGFRIAREGYVVF